MYRKRLSTCLRLVLCAVLCLALLPIFTVSPARAVSVNVALLADLKSAFADPSVTVIILEDNITLDATLAMTAANQRDMTITTDGGEFTITRTSGRHFSFTGAGAEITFENVVLSGNATGGGIGINGGTVTINNLIATRCYGNPEGGAIHVSNGAALTLNEPHISGSYAEGRGGGLFASEANVTIYGGTFDANSAGAWVTHVTGGGAIFAIDQSAVKKYSMHLEGVTFSNNLAHFRNTSEEKGEGGAILIGRRNAGIEGGLLNFTAVDCVFDKNTATVNGSYIGMGGSGGIDIYQTSNVSISGCDFTENTTTGMGGALCVYGAPAGGTKVSISDSTFYKNSGLYGGAISIRWGNFTAAIDNCTITENIASTTVGGGVFLNNSAGLVSSITDCTISGNSTRNGGGIYNESGILNVIGGEISGNVLSLAAGAGGGIFNSGTLNVDGATITGHTITGNGGGIYNNGSASATASNVAGNATLSITGSRISGNTAANGGGVCNYAVATVSGTGVGNATAYAKTIINGGIIENNTATSGFDSTAVNTIATSGDGGGVYNASFTTVTNRSGAGTGVPNANAEIYINSGTISGNTADGYGGGINNANGNTSITGGAVSGNDANYGGGLSNSTLLVRRSKVDPPLPATKPAEMPSDYLADPSYDAVRDLYWTSLWTTGWNMSYTTYFNEEVSGDPVIHMSGGDFSGNTAVSGGGILLADGSLTLEGTAGIIGNTAQSTGGGVYAAAPVTINGNAEVSDNQTGSDGGGVYSTSTVALHDNARIINNQAPDGDGGGIYSSDALVNVTAGPGVVFSDNLAQAGYLIDPADIPTHEANILTDVFSWAYAYGYNNHDINYQFDAPIGNVLLTYDNGLDGLAHMTEQFAVHSGAAVPLAGIDNVNGIDWTRAGYALSGWLHEGTVYVYPPGEVIIVDADLTFVAQWRATGAVNPPGLPGAVAPGVPPGEAPPEVIAPPAPPLAPPPAGPEEEIGAPQPPLAQSPSDTDDTDKPFAAPATSDDNLFILWIVLMLLSAVIGMTLLLWIRKKNNAESA